MNKVNFIDKLKDRYRMMWDKLPELTGIHKVLLNGKPPTHLAIVVSLMEQGAVKETFFEDVNPESIDFEAISVHQKVESYIEKSGRKNPFSDMELRNASLKTELQRIAKTLKVDPQHLFYDTRWALKVFDGNLYDLLQYHVKMKGQTEPIAVESDSAPEGYTRSSV